MRVAASSGVALTLLATGTCAQTVEINQNAWLNYTVIVNSKKEGSSLTINQRGHINGISSVQIAGEKDAEIIAHQRGRKNSLVLYQQGWITSSVAVQEGPHGPGGYKDLPMSQVVQSTDEGYLSYFQSGGFSLVTLSDPNHTWISRFGRSR